MGDEFTEALIASVSGQNNDIRGAAERRLNEFRDSNYVEFMKLLCEELANGHKPPAARAAAGLIMKVNLDAIDPVQKRTMHEAWMSIEGNLRGQMKHALLETLATDNRDAAAATSQVVAKVGAIELAQDSWPGFIDTLFQNMSNPNPYLRRATVDALGYLCEGTRRDVLDNHLLGVLSSVTAGMRKEEDMTVRLAACRALNNALEYVNTQFDDQGGRDYAMTVACECAAQRDNQDVKKAALECLVKIVQFFYQKMDAYMHSLFQIMFDSIESDPEATALQAIEFFSTVAEEEKYLANVIERATEAGQQPEVQSGQYIGRSLEYIVPMLLATLQRQDANQDEDTWNLSMAAGTCLDLVASAVGTDILGQVSPFVIEKVSSENWREREAAVFAFGTIMEGAPGDAVKELVATGVPIVVGMMDDDNRLVAESSAWTLGRICEFQAAQIRGDHLEPLVGALVQGFAKQPRVASNCVWAIHNLTQAFQPKDGDATYPLSPFYENIMSNLVDTTERQDADIGNLRSVAYTTMNVLVKTAAPDCLPTISTAFNLIVDRLEMTFNMHDGAAERQALICGVLQVITQKVGEEIFPYAERLMTLYMRVFESQTSSATVNEEALLAVGALANAIGQQFQPYMDSFFGVLKFALQNVGEAAVCSVAVGVVGDVCRALEGNMMPYWNDLVAIMLNNLMNENVHRMVKPAILSCFGDIALAIGGEFQACLKVVMQVLHLAAQQRVDQNDADLVEYLNELRENIFEAYTGIIQGLNGADKAKVLLPYVKEIFEFIYEVYVDQNRSFAVTVGAVGALADLGHALGSEVVNYLTYPHVQPMIRECGQIEDDDAIEVSNFAKRTIRNLTKSTQ